MNEKEKFQNKKESPAPRFQRVSYDFISVYPCPTCGIDVLSDAKHCCNCGCCLVCN